MNLFDSLINQLEGQMADICAALATLPQEERIEAINRLRLQLHHVSPFASEPVDCVLWVKSDTVHGNDYNPNKVAPPEMRLLERSIMADGYTQPVVGCADDNGVEIVDGFHRSRVGKESKSVRERIHGYLPVAFIKASQNTRKDKMAATIRHNRARGVHGVIPMADIVAELIKRGWHDDQIAQELGMDADEVLRFKQNKGLPELFANQKYSKAWE